MRHLLLIAGLSAATATSAGAAPATTLSPAIKQDVQCFVLYSVAAGNVTDEKQRTAAIAGTWYFLGRIDAKSPGLDLEQAMRQEIDAMQGNETQAKAVGTACDAQFSKRGGELTSLGERLQKPAH